MLRVEDVHVLRHKVLVEGLSRRQAARELGISRNTVRRYLTLAEPVRVEREPRRKPVGMTTPFGPTLMSTVSDFVRLTVQRKCPFGWSLMVDDAAPWHPGGPPARTYLLMVLREMPSSRAVARIESPCRRAC